MKKINLFIIATFFVLCSCSTEDVAPEISSDIIGTWIATSVDYGGQTVTEVSGESLTNTFTGEGYDIDFTVTFNDSPKTYISDGSYSIHLTNTVLGQTFTEDVENVEFLENGSWEQNGNRLIIESQGEETEGTIEKLTQDEFVLFVESIEDLSEQGATITSTIVVKVTFTRKK
ncbi:hypothetical protein [Mariniflexile sp. HMF6888]|uniref:hypothetical protein n=1 Tax=Mariniflexile sp. HMF6888 TaxID=3373086 RepID=UPI0037B6F229